MSKMVKYPDGSIREISDGKNIKKVNYRKAKLGIDFESLINNSNGYYLNNNIAAIYKKPTPIQIVKVDYPARNKAKIVEAYYRVPSTTDYNGIYKQKYIDFEAKSCKEMNFSFERIYEHQVNHLEKIDNLGGISFLIIEFSSVNEIYVLPAKLLVEKFHESKLGGRKSLPYQYFCENGIKVEIKINQTIDYLTAVDTLFFDDKNKQGTV